MLEMVTLDSHTLIIKSDNETDLPEIIDAINQKGKLDNINSFLEFASKTELQRGSINLIVKIVMADKAYVDSNVWLYLFLQMVQLGAMQLYNYLCFSK